MTAPTASTRPRASTSTSTTSDSLLQDLPGSFPAPTLAPDDSAEAQESTPATLSQAVHARRAEYVRPKRLRIKTGTWNVAAYKGTEKDVGAWFVRGQGLTDGVAELSLGDADEKGRESADSREDVAAQEERYRRKRETVPCGDPERVAGGEEVGLYVLGLQEVVDINSASEALKPYTDPAAANKWKEAMEEALPPGYRLVAEQQLIGLLLLIYARSDVASEVRGISTTSVGTGLMGYMGNKGAVTARLVLGDTTRLVFVNSHLGAGSGKASLDRRNWDAGQIVQRTRFEPIQDAMDLAQSTGEQIGEEDFAFWMGDLNYRIEGVPGEDVRRLLMLHTKNEYDSSRQAEQKIDEQLKDARERATSRASSESNDSSSSSSSTAPTQASTDITAPTSLMDEANASDDPTSLQTTLACLLPHDELHQQMKKRKAFHDGWKEGEISFLPTYKYDAGTVGVFDSSEKKRGPSWCDRILYRTRRGRLAYEAKVREEESAKKRDEEMKASGTAQAAQDEEILYDYDPEQDGDNADDDYDEMNDYDDANDGTVITKDGFEDEIELEYYTAHQRVLSSDHKPLGASFMLTYDAIVPELKAKIHAEVAKSLDKAENESRPNVTVVVDQHNTTQSEQQSDGSENFEGVWFGDVRWAQSKHRSITIANTGRVSANFSFIERPVGPGQAPGVAPVWLNLRLNGASLASSTTTTPMVTVAPGDTASVELSIRIKEMSLVKALNEGVKRLDDILVLRVEGGRDHFIPVRGRWLDTSLGHSISRLVRIPEGGIRKLQNQRPDSSKGASGSRGSSRPTSGNFGAAMAAEEGPVRHSAPLALFYLTEAVEDLAVRAVAEWDMTAPHHHSTDATADSPTIPQEAPWAHHPAWPFDSTVWPPASDPDFTSSLSTACAALDTATALEPSLPAHLTRLDRLYVLSSLLLTFLHALPDGPISAKAWPRISTYLTEAEKASKPRRPSAEGTRTALQEILAADPAHSISFVLVTAMLDRIVAEVGGAANAAVEPPAPLSPGKRPAAALRRMTGGGGRGPATGGWREMAAKALGRVFGEVLVKGDRKGGPAEERRRGEVVEVFLRRE